MIKYVKSVTKCYNKISDAGKILLFTAMFLILVVFFKNMRNQKYMTTFMLVFMTNLYLIISKMTMKSARLSIKMFQM